MPTPAIAYFRVSTSKQGESGLGLEAQRAAVAAYARSRDLDVQRDFEEVETGTRKRRRPQLEQALEETRRIGGVLLIAKLDRLARNVAVVSALMESGVRFVAVDMPEADNLTIHVMAAVAEREAALISSRTKAALAALKARGVVLGKPENLTLEARHRGGAVTRQQAVHQMRPAAAFARHLHQQGCSLRVIAQHLTEGNFPTRTGKGTWTAMGVKRLLDRTA